MAGAAATAAGSGGGATGCAGARFGAYTVATGASGCRVEVLDDTKDVLKRLLIAACATREAELGGGGGSVPFQIAAKGQGLRVT